jgi:hypothetical protein
MDSEVDLSLLAPLTTQDSIEIGSKKNQKGVNLPTQYGFILITHAMERILNSNSVYTAYYHHRTVLQLLQICGGILSQNMELLSIEF